MGGRPEVPEQQLGDAGSQERAKMNTRSDCLVQSAPPALPTEILFFGNLSGNVLRTWIIPRIILGRFSLPSGVFAVMKVQNIRLLVY